MAQTGLQSVIGLLSGGDDRVVDKLHLGDRLSVAEVLKALSKAAPLTVMKLLNVDKGDQVVSKLGQLQAELDFTQSVSDLVSRQDPLNPSLNAIAEAFKRRNLGGVFLQESQDLSLQALMHSLNKSGNDSDLITPEMKGAKGRGTSTRLCFAYQSGICRWPSCVYQHRCASCNKYGHGKWKCFSNTSKSTEAPLPGELVPKTEKTRFSGEKPPNPRYRRDRN